MQTNILIILSRYHLELYKKGFLEYARKRNVEIDFFELYDTNNENLYKRKAYKYNIGGAKDAIIAEQCRKFKELMNNYDKCLFINLSGESKLLVHILPEEFEKRILFVDTMKDLTFADELKKFDEVYSFEYGDIEYAKQAWGIKVNYTPIGTSYHLHNVINRAPQYDISFVCLACEKRLAYLDKIAEYCHENNRTIFLAGHFWHNANFLQRIVGAFKFKRKHPILYRYIKNEYLTPTELAQVYMDSKICLNINMEKHHSFNTRNFDIMVLGRFLITDNENLDGIDIVPEKEFVMSNNIEDMVKKIDYYLKMQEERIAISTEGRKKVMAKYSFSSTVAKILD